MEVAEKKKVLPTPEEIEAKKPSPKPKIPEKDFGYPATIIKKKFLGGKYEKPAFTEEFDKLSSKEKFKTLKEEKKIIDKQIAKMKEENATVGFAPLEILKRRLTKEQGKYTTYKIEKVGREAKQIKRFAESGKPDTKLTEQIDEDLETVFKEFEGKNITDLNNILKGNYSSKSLRQAIQAIKKGQKDGKPAQDIRQEVGEFLQVGVTPSQVVDFATEKPKPLEIAPPKKGEELVGAVPAKDIFDIRSDEMKSLEEKMSKTLSEISKKEKRGPSRSYKFSQKSEKTSPEALKKSAKP